MPQHWWDTFKDLMPLISAGLVVVTTVGIALFVTRHINTSTKRTEFFLAFTSRFHEALAAVHALEKEIAEDPLKNPTPREGENNLKGKIWNSQAQELYRQFFGLIFDEFYSYQHNFLDREIFTEWMKWRYIDANADPNFPEYRFAIAGVTYLEGWNGWVKHPAYKQHQFTDFMNKVHAQKQNIDVEMECLILQFGPNRQRIFLRAIRFLRRTMRLHSGFLSGPTKDLSSPR
ncbi:MAG TPA: hypothetical protein VGJ20_43285 [Xanthobacteraceae bacterium]|jgi:hypothetical protein